MAHVKNILFIQTDQQRRDFVGAYGNSVVRTPQMDRLAAEGVVFEEAYTVSPICAAARASVVTGLYPTRHGVLQNCENGEPGGFDFRDGIETFGPMMKRSGIRPIHVGKWHIGETLTAEDCDFEGVHYPRYGYPSKHQHYLDYLRSLGVDGFKLRNQVFSRLCDGAQGPLTSAIQECPEEGSPPFYLANQAIGKISDAVGASQPFFLSLNFWGPHLPYILPERYLNMYDPAELEPWINSQDEFRNKPTVHNQMVRYWGIADYTWRDHAKLVGQCYGYTTLVDDAIGKVMACLEQHGILDETAVFFTSDHGSMVGAHGMLDKGPYLYEEICRIPLIVRMPGGSPQARVGGVVYNVDYMPTFLEALGLDIPDGLDGRSLMPALRGDESWRGRDSAYVEFHGHQCPYASRALVRDGWKYVFNAPDTDELYNLSSDPGELRNLLDDPASARVLRSMREEVSARMKSFKDPLLRFFVNTRLH
ncbi:MAG: sulfatase-like hydrolase/transferase [Planctomycetes bacterium]|nr:sulfatase-like hydrolase/transferase [Planctomycetota bacterium]